MQKLCVKWLLRLLTIDQNQQRVDDSGQFLVKLIEIAETLKISKKRHEHNVH
jgi:hypothetical protein